LLLGYDPFNQVYKSHLSNLFEPLKRNDIYYKIFMHTWKVENDRNIGICVYYTN